MSDLEKFRELIEQLRPIADSAREQPLSPLAQAMGRERDAAFARALRFVWTHGDLRAVCSLVANVMAVPGGPTPMGVVAAMEKIAKMEADLQAAPSGGSSSSSGS